MKISDALCIAAVAVTTVAFIAAGASEVRREPLPRRRMNRGSSHQIRGSRVRATVTFNTDRTFNVDVRDVGDFYGRCGLAQMIRNRIEVSLRRDPSMSKRLAVSRACNDVSDFTGLPLYSIS